MATPHSSLAQTFLRLLPQSLKFFAIQDSAELLRVPACENGVGDLVVRDDGEELTVLVGPNDHRHFESYCEEGTQENREQRAAGNALEWVRAILDDQIVFRNEFQAGRLISGSSWNPEYSDGPLKLESSDECVEFKWSGRIK